eukprot:978137-Amorphochlora_amoeboformis.AAC.1
MDWKVRGAVTALSSGGREQKKIMGNGDWHYIIRTREQRTLAAKGAPASPLADLVPRPCSQPLPRSWRFQWPQ